MRVGIFGFGNLGKAAEWAIRDAPDAEPAGIFTRRDPDTVCSLTGIPVYPAQSAEAYADRIDVMLICGGSAHDLPEQTPRLARSFHTVDSFDTHRKIPEHFAAVDREARESGHLALICAGWDPGLFSLFRLYATAISAGTLHTFWGPGVSQGHSDALRRIDGVEDAKQVTVPYRSAFRRVRAGRGNTLTARQMHRRKCFIVPEPGADREKIAETVRTLPDYFSGYRTDISFLTPEQMKAHTGFPHGGTVFFRGIGGEKGEFHHSAELSLRLDENPVFTAKVLLSCARAVFRLSRDGQTGCRTLFDLPPALLSPLTAEEQRKLYL